MFWFDFKKCKNLSVGLGNQHIPNRSFGARRQVGMATLAGLYSDSMVVCYYLDLGSTDSAITMLVDHYSLLNNNAASLLY